MAISPLVHVCARQDQQQLHPLGILHHPQGPLWAWHVCFPGSSWQLSIHFLLAFRMYGHIIFGPCLSQAGSPTPAAASSSTPTAVSLASFFSRLILASLNQSLLALRIGDWELNSELWHSSCTSNWTVCDRGQMVNQRQNLQMRLIDSCGLYLHHLVAMTTVTFFTHIQNFQVSKKRKRRRSSGHEEKKKRKKELSSAWLITTL